jgi:hypothetical protein
LIARAEKLAGVTRVHYEPGIEDLLTLRCADTAATLDRSLALLREIEVTVRSVEIREPSLEDAFLAATGREFEESDDATESA